MQLEPSIIHPTETLVKEKFKILLVDDRVENLIALEEMLQAESRTFIRALNGIEALRLAALTDDIGLILLDVQMPGMNGFEVAKLLASTQKTKNITVIFVTAINREEHFVLEGFKEGAVDYLSKPLNIKITRAKVKVFENLYNAQKQLKEALIEKDKVIVQLERFGKVVAHDLKTPLAGIISLITLLQMDPRIQTIEDIKEEMELLNQVSLNLSDMISSMLTDARNSENTLEEVDVNLLISQIKNNLFIPKHICLNLEKLPLLITNKIKLQHVFQNLISNAIKYHDKDLGTLQIGVVEKADFYQFFVKDDGVGIPYEDQERIFEKYEITSNVSVKDSSLGLGLSSIKTVIEEQGGKIWVDSQPQIGSTFYFTWKK